jgi:cell division protein FtsB
MTDGKAVQTVLVIFVGVILVACVLLAGSQGTISRLNQDIAKAQHDLATANRDLQSAYESIAYLRAQREELQAANETLVKLVAELEGNVSALQLKIASLEHPNTITKVAVNYSMRLHVSHETWDVAQFLRTLFSAPNPSEAQTSLPPIFILNDFDVVVEMNDVTILVPGQQPILVLCGVAEVHLSAPRRLLTVEVNGQILMRGIVLTHLRLDLWLVEVVP